MDYGYIRVAAVVPRVNVADCEANALNIIEESLNAGKSGANIIVFPELSLTGYTCGDLFSQATLLNHVECELDRIRQATSGIHAIIFVGAPLRLGSMLFNCAVAINEGKFLGVVPKTYLPNYKEFYEKRWFSSSELATTSEIRIVGQTVGLGTDLLFCQGDVKIGVEICEDLWTPVPPSSVAALNGANIIVNISASNELIGKHEYLMGLIRQQSARCMAAYIYASSGFGESTTDVVFAGNAIIAENGALLESGDRFSVHSQISIADVDIEMLNTERRVTGSFADNARRFSQKYREVEFVSADDMHSNRELMRHIPCRPFVPSDDKLLSERCEEIINIQVEALMRRLSFTHIKSVVIGVSGGLDSTLALLIAHRAFERLDYPIRGIVGITMPGFGTTGRTYNNAQDLMQRLGVTIKEISIVKSVEQHFSDIGHNPDNHDVTYENCQARERTQILMDYSNKCNGLVIGTGDLSELALGWATYNGDHMSMYGVNVSIPKTLVKYLVRWFALSSDNSIKDTLLDIIDTPISPELIPAAEDGTIKQKTEDLVGPYELHDFFLYYVLRHGFSPQKIYYLALSAFNGVYSDIEIKKWMKTFYKRFFQQQFKRSCLPDGPKVGSVSLSPRGDWRMPSDASSALWIAECESL